MTTSKQKDAIPTPVQFIEQSNTSKKSCQVVGIGASAGGLEALEEFFLHCEVDTGLAYVVVQHLDPHHVSLLADILQRSTSMKVSEVKDQTKVKSNCIYIIPPNTEMTIKNNVLRLSLPNKPHGLQLPIDRFFISLANHLHERAIGIILSGTGADGTLGLRAIMEVGGIGLVQDPATAKFDGMPISAITSGYVTKIVAVSKMPELLKIGVKNIDALNDSLVEESSAGGLRKVLMQLRIITGHDFTLYKQSTVLRRVERRMYSHDIKDIDAYARFLKEFPAEAHILFKELLINVTSFFRDPEAFSVLENDALQQLCLNKQDDYNFRVWVAGCATGEEAYSIAILLKETMDRNLKNFKVQIYASDLDEDAITFARSGFYPLNISQNVSEDRLRRYFTKEQTGYKVKKEIRNMVIFAVHNVIKDPPFTKLDLLSCRNLMIYLGADLQNKLIPTFHYALKPDGVLFVSPSEGIGNFTSLFMPISRKWKIYRSIPSLTSASAKIDIQVNTVIPNENKSPEKTMKQAKDSNLSELTRRLLVQYYAPASVVTDTIGNILYVHGDTGRYLRPAPGQASLNVIEMARDGLEMKLRVAIHEAVNQNKLTLNDEVLVKTNGGFSSVNLSVRQIVDSASEKNRFLLISFQEVIGLSSKLKRKSPTKPEELKLIEALENDLLYLKESHQTLMEEQQATNEELKSANEELQSTNEELQSSNEELETSKEELQSINEELITVNSELQTKMDQLSDMQNDMKNLLDYTEIGIIFLDDQLRIRNFTREALRVYRLLPSDVGRPLSDIRSTSEKSDNLIIKAQEVLDSLVPFETELYTGDKWVMVRILPYRTTDNIINGIVLTFTDITARVKNSAMNQALDLAEGIVNTVREPIVVLDAKMNIMTVNSKFLLSFEVKRDDIIGRTIFNLKNNLFNTPELHQFLEERLITNDNVENSIVLHNFPDTNCTSIELRAHKLLSKLVDPSLIMVTFTCL